ncbi:hypothetical protein BUE80_DR011727 [Diplocarpon rosae]|nr:hypothetical protein BUE80_DR011727 [Diplocarpon rosae]
MSTKAPEAAASTTTPLPSDEPPPPYIASSRASNPGFSASAYRERHATQMPGGIQTGLAGLDRPPAWESHIAAGQPQGERLGCGICWEDAQHWVAPMRPEDGYRHLRQPFFVEGYRIGRGKTGAMQRRRNCDVARGPKIHS